MMRRRFFAWLGWLLAAVLLYFFENNTGTRAVLGITLLVPLLSMGCARMAVRRPDVVLKAPATVTAGEKIRCRIQLPKSIWRAGCSMSCMLNGRNGLTGETFGQEVPVPYGGICEAEAESSRCGCLTVSVSRAEARDWFGLTRCIRAVRPEVSVMIRPETDRAEIRKNPDPGSGSPENGGDDRPEEDPEPGDLRPYIPGDSLRRIHWKLSEKMNQTQIREFAPEAAERIALLLDTGFPEQIDPETAHAAARDLLSFSRALAAESISHAVVTARDGEAVITDVAGEECFPQAEEQVLTTESSTGGAGIEALFQACCPDETFRRVILFGGRPGTAGVLPAEQADDCFGEELP